MASSSSSEPSGNTVVVPTLESSDSLPQDMLAAALYEVLSTS
jgi:hypothetical protein